MAELQPVEQEAERVGSALPLGIMLWVLLFSAILGVVAYVVLHVRDEHLRLAPESSNAVRPEPRAGEIRTDLFAQPGAAKTLRASQRQALQNYGWVDRERGIVRIPIDRAMELELRENGAPQP